MTVQTTIRTLTLSLILVAASCDTTAQVTLGSTEPPSPGALLDLKEEGITTRGLGLPRVSLLTNSSLEPCLTSTESNDIDQRKAHIGLVVYNVGAEIETTKEDRLCKGMHVWDGDKWQPLTAYFDPDITRSGRKEDLTIQRGPGAAEVTTYTTAYFHGYSRVSASGAFEKGSIYVCDKSKLKEIDAGQWMTMNLRTKFLPGSTNEITLHTGAAPNGDSHHVAQYISPLTPAGVSPSDIERNGLLYNWPAATANRDPNRELETSEYNNPPKGIQGICPDGWHLPDIKEMEELAFLFSAQHHLFSNTPYTPNLTNSTNDRKANEEATAEAVTSTLNGGTSFSAEQGGMDWRRVGARWSNSVTQSPPANYGKAGFLWSSTSGPVSKGTGHNGDKNKWNFRGFNMVVGFVKGITTSFDRNQEIVGASSTTFLSRPRLQSVRCKKD